MILRDEHDYPRLGDLLMKAAGLTEADIRAIKDQLAAEAAEKRKDEAAAADVRTALCRWLGNDDAVQGIRLKDGSLLTLPAVVQE
jgi:hypothetical protein